MSILNETHNIVRLYMHHVGKSEVPDVYHLWSCLSLIAACVADRVWFRKFADTRLFPNLYVLLVGPPGIGKGTSINSCTKFVANMPKVQSYAGNITKQALIDELSQRRQKNLPSNIWLISPELGDDVPPGQLGEELLRFLTKIYEGDFSLPIKERTRLHGLHEIHHPCTNWLAGTTKEWLTLSLPSYAIGGGSLARIALISTTYDPNQRIHTITYPSDRAEVVEHLYSRVKELCFIGGEFQICAEAKAMDEQWYMGREAPEDETVLPSWKRQHDFVLKLAMILSLADDIDLMIQPGHLKRAQVLAREAYKDLPDIITYASATPETKGMDYIVRAVKVAGQIPRYILMRKVSNRGINKRKFDEVIDTLVQQKDIRRATSPHGGVVYVWNKGQGQRRTAT